MLLKCFIDLGVTIVLNLWEAIKTSSKLEEALWT